MYSNWLQCVFIKSNWQFFLRHTHFAEFTFVKFEYWKKKFFFLLLKVNVSFLFQCKQFFLHLAYISWKVHILIVFLVRFFCETELFIQLIVILYKILYINVVLTAQIFVFLQIIPQLSLRFVAHLKWKTF